MDLCRTKRLWTSLGKLLSAESVTITVVVEARIPSSFSLWECQGKYRKLAESEKGLIFGGRLGKYRYMDMDQVIYDALTDSKSF